MDILIKSFNRPYYLERCLRSIYKYATGSFQICVLDDGTPPKYLEKIQNLFPEIKIYRAAWYNEKVAAINNHLSGKKIFDFYNIPAPLWIKHVTESSDIFLLLEDDIWLTAPVAVCEIVERMRKSNIVITKLFWGNNPGIIKGEIVRLDNAMEEILPKIPTLPLPFLRSLFYNRFKINTLLHRLGMLPDGVRFQMPFYDLYSVASAFFNKQYWLYLWKDTQMNVDEANQLLKAVEWYRNTESCYAKTTKQLTDTSFINSATNKPYKGVDLDMLHLNHHLNEAWFTGSLNSMENFPQDFQVEYFKHFLDVAADEKCTYREWLKWITKFKQQYQSIGVIID